MHGNLARITVLRPKMLSGILAGSESFRSKALKDAFAVIFKVRFHLYCISDPSPRFRHAPSQNCTFPALSFGYQGQWMNLLPGGWEGRVKAWRERKERGKRCVLNSAEMLKHSLLKRFLGQRAWVKLFLFQSKHLERKKSPAESFLVCFMNVLKKLWFQRFLTPTRLSAKCNSFKTGYFSTTIRLFPSFQISSFHWFYDYKASFTADHASYLISTMFIMFSPFKILPLKWKKTDLHLADVLIFVHCCLPSDAYYLFKEASRRNFPFVFCDRSTVRQKIRSLLLSQLPFSWSVQGIYLQHVLISYYRPRTLGQGLVSVANCEDKHECW